MFQDWGSVEGDNHAAAIISDRRDGVKIASVVNIVMFVALIAAAVWYGATGDPPALATLIVLAVMNVAGSVASELYRTHTYVMVAEQRARVLEQQMQFVQSELRDQRPAKSGPPPRYT